MIARLPLEWWLLIVAAVGRGLAAILVLYLGILLLLGMWGGRETSQMAGYYIAGKKLPSWRRTMRLNRTVPRASRSFDQLT